MRISDLNDLIRAALAEAELADPRMLMPYVLDRIDDEDLRSALALCLPAQIQRVIRTRRSEVYRITPTLNEQSRLAEVAPGTWIDSVEEWLIEARVSGLLDQRVVVNGEWKFVGDCTSDDLRHLAKRNREEAAKNYGRARFYERLADTLDRHSISTLRDALAVPA